MRRYHSKPMLPGEFFKFSTVADLITAAKRVPEKWHNAGHDTPLTYEQILVRMEQGDIRHVTPALAIIDSIRSDNNFHSFRNSWIPDVYGAYPSVPDYLAGSPFSMRRQRKTESTGVPVGLWIALDSCAGVPLEELKRRGIVTLALAMYLQQFRPVSLHVMITSVNQGGVCLSLETTPFDISVASDFLCNGETARLPMYAILRNKTNHLLGAIEYDIDVIRQRWNIPATDLVLNGTHWLDTEARTNPVAWVNRIASGSNLNLTQENN